MTKVELSPRQILGSEHQALEALTGGKPLYDFRNIRPRDATIKKMVGLDQDADAAGALIEAARGAGARP
jgi:hypothetical protein